MNTPFFKEDHISQIPALQLLLNLGYHYLSPDEALIVYENIKGINTFQKGIKKTPVPNRGFVPGLPKPYSFMGLDVANVYVLIVFSKNSFINLG